MRWGNVVLMMASVIAVFACFTTASAGGWSVVTLDRLPQAQAPGSEIEVGFTVRQHGIHPVTGFDASVLLVNHSTGERVTVDARPDGQPGHYRAYFMLNSPGSWHWQINVFEGGHTMPPLEISAPWQPAVTETATRDDPAPILWLPLAFVAIIAGVGAIALVTTGYSPPRTATARR